MKYNLLDGINIFLFIVLIILIINKINKIENFSYICSGKCIEDYQCSSDLYCNMEKNSCCKNIK